MKRRIYIFILSVLCSMTSFAWEYASKEQTVEHSVQLRAGADFTKKWDNGIRLGVSEDLRFDLYSNLTDAAFNKSYTTLTFAYAPVKYVKIDAGYTLKLLGQKGWDDPNEFLRHRAFVGVTGRVKIDRVTLSLRERAMCEIRTDSVNPLEKNQYNWLLRSKIAMQYSPRSLPIKPYVWVELVNTLNAPEYQQKDGHQYIRRVRTAMGTTWRLNKNNSLNFYYRFNYGYDRDINIKKKSGNIELIEEKSYQHAIGVTYEFGW